MKYVTTALVSDSISLGPHWVYNQSKIAREFPNGVQQLKAPSSSYHEGKKAGDLTHYGDQMLWLSQYLEQFSEYNEEGWRAAWLGKMRLYQGYVDGASKETLESDGKATTSSKDLAGASRIAPLFDLELSLEEAVAAARSQTKMTHTRGSIIDAAEFFVRAVYAVRQGKSFEEAFVIATEQGSYDELEAAKYLEQAKEADSSDAVKVGAEFGMTCYYFEAFPLTLYLALHYGENFENCLSANGLIGGDTSARALLLSNLFVARDQPDVSELYGKLRHHRSSAEQAKSWEAGSHVVSIEGAKGKLAGVFEVPAGEVKAVALFAHCFTCGKDFLPEVNVTKQLSERGIATLRVDFAGVGKSEGGFELTSFLSNVDDLLYAADWLEQQGYEVELLVGHSLGGAAVYAAASQLESVKAVVSVGAPSEPAHVVHLLGDKVDEIKDQGVANVSLAGRKFTVGKKFLDDLEKYQHAKVLQSLECHKLVMHSVNDDVVGLKNAGEIYTHLKHPKSFVALPSADHLLTAERDAKYVASIISVWVENALAN